MKTLYLGQLVGGISITSYLAKHPEHKNHEILYITEDGQYRIRKNNQDNTISFNIEYFKALVYITNKLVTSIDTTVDKISMLTSSNVISCSEVDTNATNIYIPIEKSILAIIGNYDGEPINITSIITTVNNYCTIAINGEDFIFNRVTIDYNKLQIIPDSIEFIFRDSLSHFSNFNNPHNVTKEQLGLDRVDNTSDDDKNISSATIRYITDIQESFKKEMHAYHDSKNAEIEGISDEYVTQLTDALDEFRLNTIAKLNAKLEGIATIDRLKKDIKTALSEFTKDTTIEKTKHANDIEDVITESRNRMDVIVRTYMYNLESFSKVMTKYDNNYAELQKNISQLGHRINEIQQLITRNK